MKKHHYHLGILPLLSLLAMSPSDMTKHHSGRTVASDPIVEESKTVSALIEEKVELSLPLDSKDVKIMPQVDLRSSLDVLDGSDQLQEIDQKKDEKADKVELKTIPQVTLDEELEEVKVIEIDKLVDKKFVEKDLKKMPVVTLDEELEEVKLLEIERAVDKKFEDKDIKKMPVVTLDSEKEEKKDSCDHEENKDLTAKIDELYKQQNMIMQSMLSMSQIMMMSMMQQMNMYNNQNHMPNPYQYNQPFTAGNWVYHPSGFQPGQQNIFQQPQGQNIQSNFYPDQAYYGSNWAMKPTDYFNTQQQPQSFIPGSFGGQSMGFNMTNAAPTVSYN